MRTLVFIIALIIALVVGAWMNLDSWIGVLCIVGAVWLLFLLFNRAIRLMGGASLDQDDMFGRSARSEVDTANKFAGRKIE